ncbi:MAG: hypothetical protein CME40_06130 [Haliea sp.]|nr:hypothetical protein [Haliea sp.]|tara:strand:+ start:66787 stop:67419 length:633 start_codon:yes stop_codon:yes gene_type:complete
MSLLSRYRVPGEPLRSERRLELVCLLLAGLWALQLLWLLLRVIVPASPPPVYPAADALEVDPLLARPPVTAEARQAWLARPLFWEGRRPQDVVVEAEPEENDSAGKLEGITLLGLFGAGEQGGAILAVKGEQRRLLVGDTVRGWRLETLSGRTARFVADGREVELELERLASDAIRVQSGSAGADAAGGIDKAVVERMLQGRMGEDGSQR